MTNEQRKAWLNDNCQRENVRNPDAARQNVAKHGAAMLRDMIGPTCWPENYGQSPFDETYSLACKECAA